MNKKASLFLTFLLAIGLLMAVIVPVSNSALAAAEPQSIVFTPTPGADGRILYIVQAQDTCMTIALRYLNGDVDKLRELNNLDTDCVIIPNQELLLGTHLEPTSTPGPSPTPTQPPPTATPFAGNGEICIMLYDDVNGNAMLEPGEAPIAEGAISIMDVKGEITRNGKTASQPDPVCFSDLPEKEYNISVGPPEGYNATTAMNYTLTLKAGDKSIMNFGAQLSSVAAPVPVSEGGRSPLLAIAGLLLLLAGVLTGVYFVFLRKQSPPSDLPPAP